MRARKKSLFVFAAALLVGFSTSIRSSFAAMGTFEVAGGFSRIFKAESLLGASASSLSTSTGINLSCLITPSASDSASSWKSFGVQFRHSSGVNTTGSYSLQATYPMLRIGFPKSFIGFGVTPLVYQSLTKLSNTYAAIIEAGYYYAITGEFGFLASGATQFFYSSNGFGPRPAADLTVGLRLNFGETLGHTRSERSEYDGQRYPQGYQKGD